MEWFEWLVKNGPALLNAATALLAAGTAVALLVPGEQPEKSFKKISEFLDLPEGWHYGDGQPLSYEVFNEARELHRFILQLGFTKTDFLTCLDLGNLCPSPHRENDSCFDVGSVV